MNRMLKNIPTCVFILFERIISADQQKKREKCIPPCPPDGGWSRPVRCRRRSWWWSPVWGPPSCPPVRGGTRPPRNPGSRWSCCRRCTSGGRSLPSPPGQSPAQTEGEAALPKRRSGSISGSQHEDICAVNYPISYHPNTAVFEPLLKGRNESMLSLIFRLKIHLVSIHRVLLIWSCFLHFKQALLIPINGRLCGISLWKALYPHMTVVLCPERARLNAIQVQISSM